MSKKRKNEDRQAEQAIEADVQRTLGEMGWIPPTSEAEVAACEVELPEAPLPASLADADAVLGRPDKPIGAPGTLKLPDRPDIESTLRRAARQGGTIPPEIEDKMRRDREQAENASDETEDGQDSR